MNRAELGEIKKIYSLKKVKDNCSISRVAGCYVDGEKTIKATFNKKWSSLSETDSFKYIEILKKVLSGTDGKTALTLDFPLATEEKGGTQHSLLALRDSALSNDDMLKAFYQRVIEDFEFGGNYLILLFSDTYDIPVKTKDNVINDIEADEVYKYIICAICPVALEKSGLVFDEKKGDFRALEQRWLLDLPAAGFLFPAFNDRSSDIHSIMYYLKKAEENYPSFVENTLGITPKLTAKAQKEAFQGMIKDVLGEEKDFEIMQNIQGNLAKMEEDHKQSSPGELFSIGKAEVKRLLLDSGLPQNKADEIERSYDDNVGDSEELVVKNIHNPKAYEVKQPSVTVKVAANSSDLVSTQMVNGRKCLVIEITDNVAVDGLNVKI